MVTQLVVLSGKGGTGKTSVTGAMAHLASEDPSLPKPVLVDADVDAANLEILIRPSLVTKTEFYGGAVAQVHPGQCIGCGICQDVCRFLALDFDPAQCTFRVDPLACEGCAACFYQCPEEAIRMVPRLSGHWFESQSPHGTLFHARLGAAQENSGKLVALVKEKGKEAAEAESAPLMMVDGPPGIGCPAIAAASGADLALIVAEPTKAGLHDLERTVRLIDHFRIECRVVVNKADLYPEGADAIESRCREWGVETLGRLPYDSSVSRAMVQRRTVTEMDPNAPVSLALKEMWEEVKIALRENGLEVPLKAVLHPSMP